jgi:hypothetical protein
LSCDLKKYNENKNIFDEMDGNKIEYNMFSE